MNIIQTRMEILKEEYGITPLEYILRQRIDHAKKIMADPALSITEVAYSSGSSDQHHSAFFRNNFSGVIRSLQYP